MFGVESKGESNIRVGIPRALLYYQYYPMWRTFFQELGADVVVSRRTDRSIVDMCSRYLPPETCISTKVYCGHVMSLSMSLREKCDYVFIPVVRSLRPNSYNCSKLLGLPDLVKSVVPGCPQVLSVCIDLNKGKRALYESIYRLARPFTWNPITVKKAGEAALKAHQDFQDLMSRESLTIPEAIERLYPENDNRRKEKAVPSDLTVAVIGHPYIIYDEYVNNWLVSRLRGLGVRVVTPEMTTVSQREEGIKKLVGYPSWACEDEMIGAAGHYLDSDEIDGIVNVVPFGCGPDSIMEDIVQAVAKRRYSTKSYMLVTVDEHTGAAGLVTRLEAYVETNRRRKATTKTP